MHQNNLTSIITTASGLFGGTARALTNDITLASVTPNGIAEVILYAAISALTGYAVKLGVDYLRKIAKKGGHK
jgi:hypothetical protein